jgi:hypothetical protein
MEHLAGAASDGVDEDVDPAEALDRLGHHPIRVGFLRHVCRDRVTLRSGGLDPLDRGPAGLGRPARNGDARPRAGKSFRERRSDATTTARDQRDAAFQAEQVELAHRAPPEDRLRHRCI